MTAGVPVDHHPARAGVVLALVAGLIAVAAVADADGQLAALGLEAVGVLALSVGVWRLRAGNRIVGGPLVAAGCLAVSTAIGYGAVWAIQTTHVVELLPGMVGIGLLTLGGLPVKDGWARGLVAAGAIAIGIAIVASGIVHGAGRLRLLVGMALVVIAWDAAEQAINLGEQVGHRGASAAVIATHSAWSVGVGVVGVAMASSVYALDVTGLPIVGVGLLLAAAVALATAAFT